MSLQGLRAEAKASELGAVGLVAPVAAVAMIVVAPTLGLQLAAVAASILVLASVLVGRAGRFLNAAWVIVAAIYLLNPGDALLLNIGFPIPMVAVVAVAPIAFVAIDLLLHGDARPRLIRILPLLLLAGLAGFSLLWSSNPEIGLRKWILWAMTGLVPCAAILVLASPARPVAWKLVGAVALVYAVGLMAFGTTTIYPGRLVFFDANPIWVARAVFVGALITLFGPFRLPVKLVLLPIMLAAGYLTDSLGPTVGLALGIAAGVAEILRRSDLRDRRVQLAWAGLGVAVGIGAAVFLGGALSGSPPYLVSVLGDPNVTSRALYLEVAGQTFSSAPIVGAGLGSFASSGLAEYPHNIIAEVAAELGIVGLACLFAWIAMALRAAIGSPLLLSLVVATTVFALFSGSLAGNAEFWMFSGLAVAMAPLRRSSESRAEVT